MSVVENFELTVYEPSALATKLGGLKTGIVLFLTGLRAREYACASHALRLVSVPGGRYVSEEEYQKLSAAFPVNEEAVAPVTDPAALARRKAKAAELLGIKPDVAAPVLDERARKRAKGIELREYGIRSALPYMDADDRRRLQEKGLLPAHVEATKPLEVHVPVPEYGGASYDVRTPVERGLIDLLIRGFALPDEPAYELLRKVKGWRLSFAEFTALAAAARLKGMYAPDELGLETDAEEEARIAREAAEDAARKRIAEELARKHPYVLREAGLWMLVATQPLSREVFQFRHLHLPRGVPSAVYTDGVVFPPNHEHNGLPAWLFRSTLHGVDSPGVEGFAPGEEVVHLTRGEFSGVRNASLDMSRLVLAIRRDHALADLRPLSDDELHGFEDETQAAITEEARERCKELARGDGLGRSKTVDVVSPEWLARACAASEIVRGWKRTPGVATDLIHEARPTWAREEISSLCICAASGTPGVAMHSPGSMLDAEPKAGLIDRAAALFKKEDALLPVLRRVVDGREWVTSDQLLKLLDDAGTPAVNTPETGRRLFRAMKAIGWEKSNVTANGTRFKAFRPEAAP